MGHGSDNLRWLPETWVGWWSLGLLALGLGSFAFMSAAAAAHSGGAGSAGGWWLTTPAATTGLGTLAAGAVGGFAIFRRHERGALVFVTTAIGLSLVFFLVSELFTPH